jgi:ketosteroid isomerase-like protein
MADNLNESVGDRNAALVKKYIDANEARDKAALMEFVTEDSLYEFPFNEGGIVEEGHFKRFKGLKELSAFFDALTTAFTLDEGVRVSDRDISIANDGNTIFLECTGSGRLTTGRLYKNRYVMKFDFKDGKIIHFREYFNPIQVAYAYDRLLAGRYKVDSLEPPVTA